MKELIKRLIPDSFFRYYKHLLKKKKMKYYEGDNVICPFCHSTFSEFGSFGLVPRKNAKCHNCESLERHRLLWLYFNQKTKLFKTAKKIRLLHFAPEKIFYDIFSNHQNIEYYPCDLYPETYRYHGNVSISKVDVTKIPFEDNSFDVVICNHVLEHVIEDQLAMSEIYRVLKKGGWSILQVPIDQDREVTFEDFSITSPKERLRVFGQKDHVRCYGKDYIERLKKASFIVSQEDFIKSFSKEDLFKYGLMDSELIYHCEK